MKTTINIFGTEIPLSSDFRVTESSEEFLKFYDLTSFFFMDNRTSLQLDEFSSIVHSLIPAVALKDLRGDIFYIQAYTANAPSNDIMITEEDSYGFSVFARHENGMYHYYFKKDEDESFTRISKLDDAIIEIYSSRESNLLHFASFPNIRKTSGVVAFRRELTTDQAGKAKEWRKTRNTSRFDDTIYGDPDLNLGTAFLMNDGGPGRSCGPRPGCEHATGTSTCRADETGQIFTCVLIGDDKCLNYEILGFSAKNALGYGMELGRFRSFIEQFLQETEIGRAYIDYFSVFATHAKVKLESARKYMEVLPAIYRMMDVLMRDGSEEEIVVTNELYVKSLEILDLYEGVDIPEFQESLANVKRDLLATKGLTKTQLDAWMKSF